MANLRDELLDRLEMRRMAIGDYQAAWCTSCLRCVLTTLKPRWSAEVIWPGNEACRQPMDAGTISECINAFRAEAA